MRLWRVYLLLTVGGRLKIAGVALVGLYLLVSLVLLINDTIRQHDVDLFTWSLAILVLGGFAWLGWRHPLAAGVLAIFAGIVSSLFLGAVFSIGGGALSVRDVFIFVYMAGFPAVTGVVLVAAGLVERRARRLRRFHATT
jgi:hypothetical protein